MFFFPLSRVNLCPRERLRIPYRTVPPLILPIIAGAIGACSALRRDFVMDSMFFPLSGSLPIRSFRL